MLEGDATVRADHEGFGHAVDAPIDRDAAIEVGAGARVGVAKCVEPTRGVLRMVLVIEAIDGRDGSRLHLHDQRMLNPTFDAPGGEHVDD